MGFGQFASDVVSRLGLRTMGWTWRFSWTGFTKEISISNYKYFSDGEVEGLDKELCARLDMARDKAGVPFRITSGKRTPEQNARLTGAVSDSAHLTGLAVDLATGDDHTKNRMMYGLISSGLADRIGEYFSVDPTNPNRLIPHHLHIDIDTTKPQQVTWALMEKNE